MPRTVSRSPSYRRRHSPSTVPRSWYSSSRRSRRDRSRSPYSHRRSHSISPKHCKSRSPSPRWRKSRSPTPRRYRRQRTRSHTRSPIEKSQSPSIESPERKNSIEKLTKEEEEKRRRQREAELNQLEEETSQRIEEALRQKVEESLNSEEVKMEIWRRTEEGRKKLFDDVAAQLEKEKEAALGKARQKEEQARSEWEELDKMLEENRRRVEEAQGKEALEQQQGEEERYRELERLQREKQPRGGRSWRKRRKEQTG